MPHAGFSSQLIALNRNRGSFNAIFIGLGEGRGDYFAVMAADLQEPRGLILQFYQKLASQRDDVVVGTRFARSDPWLSQVTSWLFWSMYRWLIQPEVPKGGVDVFGCTRKFSDHLLSLRESNTTLAGLLFWLGFRRSVIPYMRRPRGHGKSTWTVGCNVEYLIDSAFAFSLLPIRFLSAAGAVGILISVFLALIVVYSRMTGDIDLPGYSATVLPVMFFGGLNFLGLGNLGEYIWRTFENTKGRPHGIIMIQDTFD